MRSQILLMAFSSLLLALTSCGGSSANPGSGNLGTSGTIVRVNFQGGGPSAAAVQDSSGVFVAASLSSGQLSFTVPVGSTRYGFAWVCPEDTIQEQPAKELVVERTLQDGTDLTVDCRAGLVQPPPASGGASGTVDASAIAGVSESLIYGRLGLANNSVVGAVGSFNATLPSGTNDIAVLAIAAQGTPLALTILRNQTVPGSVNGGNPIILDGNDLLTPQSMTFANLPAGFGTPLITVSYVTANGLLSRDGPTTASNIDLAVSSSQYMAVSAAVAQSGDGYLVEWAADSASSGLDVLQRVPQTGGPITVQLPDPWLYPGPSPAAFPILTFNYSLSSSFASFTQEAVLSWNAGVFPSGDPKDPGISLSVSNSFQSGGDVSVPDLRHLPGFFTPPSGSQVGWSAFIVGQSQPGPNSFKVVARNSGIYLVP